LLQSGDYTNYSKTAFPMSRLVDMRRAST